MVIGALWIVRLDGPVLREWPAQEEEVGNLDSDQSDYDVHDDNLDPEIVGRVAGHVVTGKVS